MTQPPGDGHGALALVGDVGGGAEEGVWGGDSAVVQTIQIMSFEL